MKGDFTRSTFRPEKHYSSVRMQQGRVQLDADWNEELDILERRIETEAMDVIGPCGAPQDNAGFEVKILSAQDLKARNLPNGDFLLSAGRCYVDGILCENDVEVSLTTQPDLPGAKPLSLKDNATFLVYLHVWQRHLTALDDPLIREVALGGPDTATRTKTVWQVHALKVTSSAEAKPTCDSQFPEWDTLQSASSRLMARAQPGDASDEPCIVPAQAGYRRLENQLYRVEIHQGSETGSPTFKWSRDNGSVVVEWQGQSVYDLTVSSLGRDTVLGFAGEQWVELTDDTHELQMQPGTLVQLAKAEGQTLTIDPATAHGSIKFSDFPLHPKVRRWDSSGLINVEVPTSNSGWIPLEDGVEVHFEAKGTYRTGDYWLIPARTAATQNSIGGIEWPQDASNAQPMLQPPAGIKHQYCRLALLQVKDRTLSKLFDCRKLFPPLTNLPAGQGPATDPGIHITDVVISTEPAQPLMNSAEVVFTSLNSGIKIYCDAPLDPTAIAGTPLSPTCFVSVDVPNYRMAEGNENSLIGFQTLILAASVTVANQATQSVVSWVPEPGAQYWLQWSLPNLLKGLTSPRLLGHLTLKGNFIWANGNPELYLDGEALGLNGGKYNLRLPSGDGRRGGTFEMWFWVKVF